MKPPKVILACVHATNAIPARYRKLFSSARARSLLQTHWAYDPGALDVTRHLKSGLSRPVHIFPVSRLLIEPDSHGPDPGFTEFTRRLPADEKRAFAELWRSFMSKIERDARRASAKGFALLIVIHSFTPIWKGKKRDCDIGILFDPKRRSEKEFSIALRSALERRLPGFRIRFNYPYTGWLEGSTGYFRKRFPSSKYAGIEIEINNKHIRRKTKNGEAIKRALAASLAEILDR